MTRTYSHSRSGCRLAELCLLVLVLAVPGWGQRTRAKQPAPPPAKAQPCPVDFAEGGTHRLVLKDGNYQSFSKCQVLGERVRYLSAERYEWEELPRSLVDWEATAQYEHERQAGEVPVEGLRIAGKEGEDEGRAAEPPAAAIAPGVRLPDSTGVFLLDEFQGKPELIELAQNGGEINPERGKSILRATLNPFAGSKQSIELKGTRAQVQAHVSKPVFYLNLEPGDVATVDSGGDSQAPATAHAVPPLAQRYRIARLDRKKNARVIGNLKVAFTGKLSQQQQLVPSTAELFSGAWVRLAPVEPLAPGEYAVVEMLSEKEMNLYVWDFGVDPSAPESPFVWRDAPAPAGKDTPPALTSRPKP